MAVEKFSHLGKIPPIPDNIRNILVEDISEEQLPILSEHFEGLKKDYSSNEEAVLAASEILSKIDKIMKLWWERKSQEIKKASSAADDYYNKMVA